MSNKQIVSKIENRAQFFNMLQLNPGLIIIKFGANWCKPCKKIKQHVESFFSQTPTNIVCCDIDIDECDEVYTYLRSKRIVSGIPTILCYKKGNFEYAPDDSFSGTEINSLESFFRRCAIYSKEFSKNVP